MAKAKRLAEPKKLEGLVHPTQPLGLNEHGTLRFKENAIVRFFLDAHSDAHRVPGTSGTNGGLNCLHQHDFSIEDHIQFAQLIGYSLSGFGELSYVTNDAYGKAEKLAYHDVTDEQAELLYLREQMKTIRATLKKIVPELFHIHPDDLKA